MTVPTRAGQAVLEYSTTAKVPSREGNVITIPSRSATCWCGEEVLEGWEYCSQCGFRIERSCIDAVPLGQLYPLMDDFEQFLYMQKGDPFKDVWFGGTDEAPFLVQMSSAVIDAHRREDFYGYIIPGSMLTLTRKWGGSWKRQGDIFAYPLPFSWEELKGIGNFNKANGLQVLDTSLLPVKGERVFQTRHILEGKWCNLMLGGRSMTIAEGIIKAPDHTDLVLEGPHALDQTANLYDPPKAD